jgi:hypothetical protein
LLVNGEEIAVGPKKLFLKENVRALWPALAVLFATLITSTFITELNYVAGMKALWLVLFRFIRLVFTLTLPLLLLPFVCSRIHTLFNQGNRRLVQLQEMRDYAFAPLKIWILRPFQGIGLVMLLAAKLIFFLQLYIHTMDTASALLPPTQFSPGRFFLITAIVAVTSLLLSSLWTLDDLGIRYCNRETKEIRMVGKYLGLILPVVFGFYGVISLFKNYALLSAIQYIIQLVAVLYPPFVIFGVLHRHYIQKHESIVLEKLAAHPYVVVINERATDLSKI